MEQSGILMTRTCDHLEIRRPCLDVSGRQSRHRTYSSGVKFQEWTVIISLAAVIQWSQRIEAHEGCKIQRRGEKLGGKKVRLGQITGPGKVSELPALPAKLPIGGWSAQRGQ